MIPSAVSTRFIELIQHLIEQSRVKSQRQFALSIDCAPQSINRIMIGGANVTIEQLRKTTERYGINPYFVLLGEYPILCDDDVRHRLSVLTVPTTSEGDERIAHVPWPVEAGYAEQFMDQQFVQELESYHIPGFERGTHRIFDVTGDSMNPSLFNGDQLVASYVDPSYWPGSIKNRHVHVVILKDALLVKRVQLEDGGASLRLISDSSYYPDQIIELAQLQELWMVRSVLREFQHASMRTHDTHDQILELQKRVSRYTHVIDGLQSKVDSLGDQLS